MVAFEPHYILSSLRDDLHGNGLLAVHRIDRSRCTPLGFKQLQQLRDGSDLVGLLLRRLLPQNETIRARPNNLVLERRELSQPLQLFPAKLLDRLPPVDPLTTPQTVRSNNVGPCLMHVALNPRVPCSGEKCSRMLADTRNAADSFSVWSPTSLSDHGFKRGSPWTAS